MTKPVFLKTLSAIFFLSILFSCSPGISSSIAVKPSDAVVSGSMEKDILGYVNQHRRSIGLSSLQMVDIAAQQAYNHSKNMALRNTGFGHDGFDQRISMISKSAGRISASAENVAYGELSASGVVKGWLNSPAHKRNMEGSYTYTGIGVYKDRQGTIYFTQIFYRK